MLLQRDVFAAKLSSDEKTISVNLKVKKCFQMEKWVNEFKMYLTSNETFHVYRASEREMIFILAMEE